MDIRNASHAAATVPLLVLIVVASAAAHAQIQTPVAATFDTGTEGWQLAGGELGTVDHASTGGDPGGFIRFTDGVGASAGHIVSPSRFHGDWSALDGVGVLSWQHQIVSPGGGPTIGELVAFLSGPGGIARHDTGVLGEVGSWVSVSAPITSTSWVVESGSWAAILADVTQLRIRIEVVSNASAGTEVAGIDNVVLDDGVVQEVSVPRREGFAQSLGGWELAPGEFGSVSHVATGGNPGGHAEFTDALGPSGGHLVAPASWRGSWLGQGAPAELAWDHLIRVLGPSPVVGTLQAELTGPGGTARFDSGQLAELQWVRVVAPIQEAQWTVLAGTWNDLLSHVTDVRIQIEAVSNDGVGEVSALDEIALLPPQAVPALGPGAMLALGGVIAWLGRRLGSGARRLTAASRR